ncbi:VWA domain-containing protein [bacterium]|nr:VWA domain-containing protein [bacterium]
MFRFAFPEMLYLLWLLPLFILGNWWITRQDRTRLQKFTGPRLSLLLTRQNSPAKQLIGRIVILLAVTSMIIGMARPQMALTRKEIKSQGLDIIFVIDTSRSMNAKDVSPSRLERVRRAMLYLVDNLSDHRIGLLLFAGNAFLNCPTTQDTGTLKLLINSLQTSTLPIPGTDLGNAMEEAIAVFQRTGARHRAVVVFSDGENFGRAPFQKVAEAAKAGIRTYCLGVGTEDGAPMESQWQNGPQQKKAKLSKNPPITRLQDKTLKKMAGVGKGTYVQLTSGGEEEDLLVHELNKLEKIELYSESHLIWKDYYPMAAMIAMLLLIWELLLGRRVGGPSWKDLLSYVKITKVIGLILVLLLPSAAQASRKLINRGVEVYEKEDLVEAERVFNEAREERTGDALAEYNLGCAQLAQHKYDQAYSSFARALPYAKGTLLQDNWYNLGYTAFYIGIKKGAAEKWQEALDGFKQVLLLNPQDDDARYNLELILREIKKRTRQAARRQQKSQGQEQGQDPGSGANKPGPDRQDAQGRKNDKAPPSEAQENTAQRRNKNDKPSTSEEQQGNREKGMSQEDALRTLRSLEAQESNVKNDLPQDDDKEHEYRGPGW